MKKIYLLEFTMSVVLGIFSVVSFLCSELQLTLFIVMFELCGLFILNECAEVDKELNKK